MQLFFTSYSAIAAEVSIQPVSINIPRECDVAYSNVKIALLKPSGEVVSGKDMMVGIEISNKGSAPVADISLVARVERIGVGAGVFMPLMILSTGLW